MHRDVHVSPRNQLGVFGDIENLCLHCGLLLDWLCMRFLYFLIRAKSALSFDNVF